MLEKQNIVIFDGPDGCGKTNIATSLSGLLSVPYFKNHAEWTSFGKDDDYFINAIRFADPYFLSYLEQSHASIILDRAYPAEWVYSQAFGRSTDFNQLVLIDRAYAKLDAKIIVPYRTSYDNVIDQFEQLTPAKLLEIEQLYRAFVEWTKCKALLINVDDENINRQICEIVVFLMEQK